MEGLGALPHSLPNIWPFLCGSYTYAVGINLRSEIVGDNRDFDTYISAFRWTKAGRLNGVERLLGSFTYNSLANGINNQGHIVGESGHLGLKEHAMVVKDGVAIDLGTLAGADPDGFYCAAANGINDRGQIVGYSSLDASPQQTCLLMRAIGSAHAWAWDQRGGMRDLGVLAGDKSSVALKINYFGQVVGISGNTFTFDYAIGRATLTGRPFIWTERGGMRDLNNLIPGNSGWVLNAVSDINVWGQIIGVGTRNGESRGFLLTPKIL
jgi:probable HAF family extracellular repeat protein